MKRFNRVCAIVLICLLLPLGTAQAATQVTRLESSFLEMPTHSQRSLLDAITVQTSSGKTWIESEEDRLDFEVVRGEGVVTLQGEQIRTGDSEGTALVRASLHSDPGISTEFYVRVYPKKYQVTWLGTNMATGDITMADSYCNHVNGMCMLFRPEGEEAFYPVKAYEGEFDWRNPCYLDANGKLELGEDFSILAYTALNNSIRCLEAKRYEVVEATKLDWYIRSENKVQVGDRCYFGEGSSVSLSSATVLSGNCRGTWGALHNYRKALAAYFTGEPQQTVRDNCEIEMAVPYNVKLISDPGGSFDLGAHLPEGTERMAVAIGHSERYQCEFYQEPLAAPMLNRDLTLDNSAEETSIDLPGLDTYADNVKLCAVWAGAEQLELSRWSVPLQRQGNRLTVLTGELIPGEDYYLYAQTDDEHYSLPSKGKLTVPGSARMNVQLLGLTAGSEGRLDITLVGAPAQEYEVTFSTDSIAIAPTKSLDYRAWDAIGGIRADVRGSFGGREIAGERSVRTVSFSEQDGNATASIPITLCKAGEQSATVEVKGYGRQTLKFNVEPHSSRALLLDIPCVIQPGPNNTPGGGTVHFGNQLRLVDKYANVITGDNSSVVTVQVEAGSGDQNDLTVTDNQFTLQNGIADLNAEPMAVYSRRRGFRNATQTSGTIFASMYATCNASGAYKQFLGTLEVYPLYPEGWSTTGDRLTGLYAPKIKEIRRVTEDGKDYFRIYLDGLEVKAEQATWGAGIFGGTSGNIPVESGAVFNGGSVLKQDEGGVYSDCMKGNVLSSALSRLNGAALYVAHEAEPCWGYISIVSDPVDLSNVKEVYAGSSGTLTGLKPNGWYCVCGNYYDRSGTSWTGIQPQEVQADANGRLTFDVGSYDLELLELDLVEVRDTSFSWRTRFHNARFSVDQPIAGMEVCLRPELIGDQKVKVTVDSYINRGIVAQQLFCVAYTSQGRPIATRSQDFFYDAKEMAAQNPYQGDFSGLSEEVQFDFSGVSGIDHYKMFIIDLNGIPQAGSATLEYS